MAAQAGPEIRREAESTATMTEAIDTLCRNYFPDEREPGASALVARNGDVLFCGGYGVADLATREPVTSATNFRLASLTKQFTAMAIMLLREDGRLSLADPAALFLDNLPDYASTATIRHLLSHTSGLPDYEDLIPPSFPRQVLDGDVPDLLTSATQPLFAPGEKYAYSNTGYALLALIVERVSGESFARFLERRIFAPLGMTGTVAYERGINRVPCRAFGTRLQDGVYVDSDQSTTSAVLGDGGVYCSGNDYLKWEQALRENRLVSRDVMQEILTPVTLSSGAKTSYGYGWSFEEKGGDRVVFHTGTTCGFNTCVRRIPARGILVLVFCNRQGGEAKALAAEIEALLLDRDASSSR
jgi:CubicO group peptidase (beta-lactamase class C family)